MLLCSALATGLIAAADPAPPPAFDLNELLVRVGAWDDSTLKVRRSWTEDFTLSALDGDGKATSTAHGAQRVSQGKDGAPGAVISSCEVDGVPQANPEKVGSCSPHAKVTLSGAGMFSPTDPFGTADQKSVTFTAASPPSGGIVRVRFQPKTGSTILGFADIDVAKGTPTHVEWSDTSQPHIDKVTTRIDYADFGPLGILPSRVEFSGSGSFLFFHTGMHGVAQRRDYQAIASGD